MMSTRITTEITRRVLRELFREPRSRIFLVGAPALLLAVVRYIYDSAEAFAYTGVMMIGAFPAFSMLVVGSITLVRERNRGTLEAVLATPASRLELVSGYLGAAVVLAFFQALCTIGVAYWVCDLDTASPPWLVGIIAMLSGIFGMSLGLCVSAVSKNEGEASHFIPGVMVPQLLICGAFWPVEKMTDWLQSVEQFLPLAAVTRAMTAARENSYGGMSLVYSLTAMIAIIAIALVGAAATIQRRTA